MTADATIDPGLAARVPVAPGHPFPIQNLPYGAFVRPGDARARIGVAIGDFVLDLAELARAGIFDGVLAAPESAFDVPRLNEFLARGRGAWRGARERISALLRADTTLASDERDAFERALHRASDVRLELAVDVGDYVDCYSSRYHAENVGRLFRPSAEPLLPNWRHVPVGYHGRASGVVVDGTPVTRPWGQLGLDAAASPVFAPTRMLDYELELGFVTGSGPPLGVPLAIEHAAETIFGVVLLNDWSSRDVQAWENQPLGPFLSKAFATSISAWVVPLDALAPFALEPPDRPRDPLPYLRGARACAYDIELEVELAVGDGDARERATVARSNAKHLFWSMPQQLAHLASCGARVRAGDLFGTGTISGPSPESAGSLLERTRRGTEPIAIGARAARAFLQDGDEVVMRGSCTREGAAPIGFGALRGTIAPAHVPASASIPASENPSSR